MRFVGIVRGIAITLALAVGASDSSSCPELLFSENQIVIALGHDSASAPLQHFADRLQKRLAREVITYREFSKYHYVDDGEGWWEKLPPEQVTARVERALQQAVAQAPNTKVLAFNLDQYDPKELFGPDGEQVWTYTNFEIDLILRNPILFSATRWYRGHRELSQEEAEKFWAPTVSALRGKRRIAYGP